MLFEKKRTCFCALYVNYLKCKNAVTSLPGEMDTNSTPRKIRMVCTVFLGHSNFFFMYWGACKLQL